MSTDSKRELPDLLVKGARKIMISKIQKFREAMPNMNTQDRIHLLAPRYAAWAEKLPPTIQHLLPLPPPE